MRQQSMPCVWNIREDGVKEDILSNEAGQKTGLSVVVLWSDMMWISLAAPCSGQLSIYRVASLPALTMLLPKTFNDII